MEDLSQAIIRTLAFQAGWGYAPTIIQLFGYLDTKGVEFEYRDYLGELRKLKERGILKESSGRVVLSEFGSQIAEGKEKEFYFPRKLRKARRIAGYLMSLPWVKAVFLCNTTALGQARDGGDLDFLVVAKANSLWRTRFFSVLPFKLMGGRPSAQRTPKDPACFSFFISDESLDLSGCTLDGDDPYFRYWFLTLLPLRADDRTLQALWSANSSLLSRHPKAERWMSLDQGKAKPSTAKRGWTEAWLERLQRTSFPSGIKERQGKDTGVIANDQILKFHVDDRRREYRDRYLEICKEYGVEP